MRVWDHSLVLHFMFYSGAEQVSRAAPLCLSVLLLFSCKFLMLHKMHTHAPSHCRDVTLLGNKWKTIGKCNWFSRSMQRLEGVGVAPKGRPSSSQPRCRLFLSTPLLAKLCSVNI